MFIIEDHEAWTAIAVRGDADFAAAEFQRYLERITGCRIPLGERTDVASVVVGTDDELPLQAFRIRCDGRTLSLSGRTRLEALHAVYFFLERYAGCFWAAPGEDDLPESESIDVPDIDETHTPDLPLRGLQLNWISAEEGDLPVIDWMTKRRMNFASSPFLHVDPSKRDVTIAALKKRGMEFMFGLHTFQDWLPPKYFMKHPEFYAFQDGKRLNPNETKGAQICMSNPAAIALCAENLIHYLERNEGIDIIGLGPNDGIRGWCECENCLAVEPTHFSDLRGRFFPDRTKSLVYGTFCNRVVEKVAQRFPNQRFAALFYSNTLPPPEDLKFRLHPNIDAVLALFERYYDRPLNAGVSEKDYHTMPPDLMLEQRYTLYPDLLRRWREITLGRVFLHAYFMGKYRTITFPFFRTIIEDIRLLSEVGIDGFYTQAGASDFGTYGLNAHLSAEASYHTTLLSDEIVQHYCQEFFGPAAEPMTDYYRQLERMACDRHNSPAPYLLLETFDERTSELRALLEWARNAVQDGKTAFSQRVEQACANFDYACLCKQYRYGWLRARRHLQNEDLEAVQTEYGKLDETKEKLLSLAESNMIGKGLTHFPDVQTFERSALGSLRRHACAGRMKGDIDFDIPWDVE